MKQSKKLSNLALMGISAGLLASSCQLSAAEAAKKEGNGGDKKAAQEATMTEEQLVSQLNERGKALYDSLDAEGKGLARQLAAQTCAGKNACAGLNSCKTDKNECAGLAACKGQTKGAFTDKNLAVKVAAKKIAEKRAKNGAPVSKPQSNATNKSKAHKAPTSAATPAKSSTQGSSVAESGRWTETHSAKAAGAAAKKADVKEDGTR